MTTSNFCHAYTIRWKRRQSYNHASLLFMNRIKTRDIAVKEFLDNAYIRKTSWRCFTSMQNFSGVFQIFFAIVSYSWPSDVHGVIHRVRSIGRSGHETGIRIDIRVGHQQDVRRRVRRAKSRLREISGGHTGSTLGNSAFRHRARIDDARQLHYCRWRPGNGRHRRHW